MLGCILCVVASLAATSANVPQSDFFQFWAAGHIVAAGGTPYDAATWQAVHSSNNAKLMDGQFIYPLPVAIMAMPLGFLSPSVAYLLWFQLSTGMLATAVLLCTQSSRRWVIVLLVAGLAFRPVLSALIMGHLVTMQLLAAAAAWRCWTTGRWAAGGLAMSLLAIKPGLGLPIIGLVALWLAARRRWAGLAGLAAGGAGLGLIGVVYMVDWPIQFVAIIMAKPGYYGQPSLAGLGLIGVVVAIVLVLEFCRLALFVDDIGTVIGMALAVGLAVAPYVWTYDHALLLLPILVLLGRWPAHLAVLALLAVDLLAAGLAVASSMLQIELINVALPVAVAISVELDWLHGAMFFGTLKIKRGLA